MGMKPRPSQSPTGSRVARICSIVLTRTRSPSCRRRGGGTAGSGPPRKPGRSRRREPGGPSPAAGGARRRRDGPGAAPAVARRRRALPGTGSAPASGRFCSWQSMVPLSVRARRTPGSKRDHREKRAGTEAGPLGWPGGTSTRPRRESPAPAGYGVPPDQRIPALLAGAPSPGLGKAAAGLTALGWAGVRQFPQRERGAGKGSLTAPDASSTPAMFPSAGVRTLPRCLVGPWWRRAATATQHPS